MRARQHSSLVRRVQLHRAARVREIVGVGVGIVIRPFRPLPVPLLVRGRRPSAAGGTTARACATGGALERRRAPCFAPRTRAFDARQRSRALFATPRAMTTGKTDGRGDEDRAPALGMASSSTRDDG